METSTRYNCVTDGTIMQTLFDYESGNDKW